MCLWRQNRTWKRLTFVIKDKLQLCNQNKGKKYCQSPASQETGLRKLWFSSLFFYILSNFSPVINFNFLNSYMLFLLLVIIDIKDNSVIALNSFIIYTTKGIFLAESRSIHLKEPKSILVCVIQEFVLKD